MTEEQGLLSYLQAHRDANLDVRRVDSRRLRSWLADMDDSTRAGVCRAWLVGRVLSAERATLKQGEVEEWEKARARELARSRRTLQLYRFLADSLENEEVSAAVRANEASKGLRGVLGAIRKELKRQSGQAVPTIREKVAAWNSRARRLLRALPDVKGRARLLRAHLEDVTALLDEIESERFS